jgi:hypothetical protein
MQFACHLFCLSKLPPRKFLALQRRGGVASLSLKAGRVTHSHLESSELTRIESNAYKMLPATQPKYGIVPTTHPRGSLPPAVIVAVTITVSARGVTVAPAASSQPPPPHGCRRP